jgi:hypothetical protein
MAEDFDFKTVSYYAEGDRLWVQAQRIWVILVGIVIASQVSGAGPKAARITYGDLAEVMGKPRQAGRTLTRQLWMIGEYCKFNGLPTLNSIVVNQDTGVPGHDVVLSSGNSVAQEMTNVARFNWASVRIPSTATFRDVWEQLSELAA